MALLVCLAVGGCGGQKSGFTRIGNEEATTKPGRARSEATIDMRGISFSPATVRVRPGAQVTWRNRDKVAHDATQGTQLYNEFTSGEVQPGRTYKRRFHTEQKIGYRCTIHPNMEGAILVQGE